MKRLSLSVRRMGMFLWMGLILLSVFGCRPLAKEIYWNRATAAHDRGDFKKAIAYYDKILRLDPNDLDAHFNKGVAHVELKQWDKARKEVELLKTKFKAPQLAQRLENLIRKARYLEQAR